MSEEWIDDLRNEAIDTTPRENFTRELRATLSDEWNGTAIASPTPRTVDGVDGAPTKTVWLLAAAAVTALVVAGAVVLTLPDDDGSIIQSPVTSVEPPSTEDAEALPTAVPTTQPDTATPVSTTATPTTEPDPAIAPEPASPSDTTPASTGAPESQPTDPDVLDPEAQEPEPDVPASDVPEPESESPSPSPNPNRPSPNPVRRRSICSQVGIYRLKSTSRRCRRCSRRSPYSTGPTCSVGPSVRNGHCSCSRRSDSSMKQAS